jgi:hypothetical protein
MQRARLQQSAPQTAAAAALHSHMQSLQPDVMAGSEKWLVRHCSVVTLLPVPALGPPPLPVPAVAVPPLP